MHRVFVCNEIPERIVEPLADIADLSIWPGPGPIPRHRLVRDILRAFELFRDRETEEDSKSTGDDIHSTPDTLRIESGSAETHSRDAGE